MHTPESSNRVDEQIGPTGAATRGSGKRSCWGVLGINSSFSKIHIVSTINQNMVMQLYWMNSNATTIPLIASPMVCERYSQSNGRDTFAMDESVP